MSTKYFFEEEVAEVQARYPRLGQILPGIIEGVLDMHAEFGGKNIDDSFRIKISADNPTSAIIPAISETGGRTQAIAAANGIKDLRDLHYNPDYGTACVCVMQEEKRKFPPGSRLIVFIEELVVPYFYSLSHYEAHRHWPWGEYSHGGLGLLEFHGEDKKDPSAADVFAIIHAFGRERLRSDYLRQLRKPSGKRDCLCGSGKAFFKCHKRALRGVWRLSADIERLGINCGQSVVL